MRCPKQKFSVERLEQRVEERTRELSTLLEVSNLDLLLAYLSESKILHYHARASPCTNGIMYY
jgi:hypothetical protein